MQEENKESKQRFEMQLIPYEATAAILCVDIPIRNRKKEIVAVTTVLAEDHNLAKLSSWSLTQGYACGTVCGRRYYMQKLIMEGNNILPESPDQVQIDHIDGDKLNNIRPNLRWVTIAQNHKNRRNLPKNNKSGCSGVSFDSKSQRWRAAGTKNRQKVFLGSFADKEEAVKARRKFEQDNECGQHAAKKMRLQ